MFSFFRGAYSCNNAIKTCTLDSSASWRDYRLKLCFCWKLNDEKISWKSEDFCEPIDIVLGFSAIGRVVRLSTKRLDLGGHINVNKGSFTIVYDIDSIINWARFLIIRLDLEILLLIIWQIFIRDEVSWILQPTNLDRVFFSLCHLNN